MPPFLPALPTSANQSSRIPIRACSRRRGAGGPPVRVVRDPHDGRDEPGADDGCVEQDGYCHAEAELLDVRRGTGEEGREHDGNQERCRGDDPPGALQAEGHGVGLDSTPLRLATASSSAVAAAASVSMPLGVSMARITEGFRMPKSSVSTTAARAESLSEELKPSDFIAPNTCTPRIPKTPMVMT